MCDDNIMKMESKIDCGTENGSGAGVSAESKAKARGSEQELMGNPAFNIVQSDNGEHENISWIPDIESCRNGLSPENMGDEERKRKVIVPQVISMTKYLFDNYRLAMYSYLNRILRNGQMRKIVGFEYVNRIINKQVCLFRSVNYWRMDRKNFWADVEISLYLDTGSGLREWHGYLSLWFSADRPGPLAGTIEGLFSDYEMPEREDMVMLSPYLIPYFTSARMDEEMEHVWARYIPGSLADEEKRKAEQLAKAMGLMIRHLPLYKHKGIDSVLFLIDDTVLIAEQGAVPKEEKVCADTIVINTNNIKREYSDYNIFHECVHYSEHYLFFRLQEMHSNDIMRMKTEEIEVTAEEENRITNPIYWMEKQANRGAYGLMMPETFMRGKIAEKGAGVTEYAHEGERYEKIGLAIAEEIYLPHFRIRARMVQLGHIYAKGALNYVEGNRIQPFCFSEESLSSEAYTFVIDRRTAGFLYERNEEFRQVLDTGNYIYADGHIVRNEPRFVEMTTLGHMLTPWALAHVDQCCLRFVRIYEQENVGKYTFGRMNYDAEYVKQTLFYLEDTINSKEMDEIDAEQEYKRKFPADFKEAFDMLMRRNGDTRESIAEKMQINAKTLQRWLKEPERKISTDFVVTVALIWRLPDWISALLLDRAGIRIGDNDRRQLALQYILKVLWSEGIERANEYLTAKKLECLNI